MRRRVQRHDRREAAGAALVHQEIVPLDGPDQPVHRVSVGQRLLCTRHAHDHVVRAIAEPCARVALHVCQIRLDHAEAGEVRRDRPGRRPQSGRQMSGGGMLVGGSRDERLHPERLEQSLAQRVFEMTAFAARHGQRHHHHSEIRIFGLAADRPRQLYLAESAQHALFGLVRVGIGRVGGMKTRRQHRQAGTVREHVAHEDLAVALARHRRS
jgi:hypothetical protein